MRHKTPVDIIRALLGLRTVVEKTEGFQMKTIVIEGTGKIPSKKNRMRVWNGRMIKDKGCRDFEHMLSDLARVVMNGDVPFTDDVSLSLMVIFGDRRRRDLQNLFGSVCDSLNGIVYDDDSQIVELSGEKHYIKGEWKYTIRITGET